MNRFSALLPILAMGGFATLRAKDTTVTVVVRDHLKQTSTQTQVTSKLYDSTAGSWVGTRSGIDGLPTPQVIYDPPTLRNRRVLQTTNTPARPQRCDDLAFRILPDSSLQRSRTRYQLVSQDPSIDLPFSPSELVVAVAVIR